MVSMNKSYGVQKGNESNVKQMTLCSVIMGETTTSLAASVSLLLFSSVGSVYLSIIFFWEKVIMGCEVMMRSAKVNVKRKH